MTWNILDTGINSAIHNMHLDTKLLGELKGAQPILHLYEWSHPSATYGYFSRPDLVIDYRALDEFQVTLARRPTGGGIIFHVTDFAFSILIPKECRFFSTHTMKNYEFINTLVVHTIRKFMGYQTYPVLLPEKQEKVTETCKHFCMAKPTKYDVMIGGKKVGGAAQRKVKNGFLHQGSISLALPTLEFLKRAIPHQQDVVQSMLKGSAILLPHKWTEKMLKEARFEVKEILKQTCIKNRL